MKRKLIHALFQIAVAIDQFLNTCLGGWADETLSARCWRHRAYPGWNITYHIIDAVFFWQRKPVRHCQQAYESERSRAHLPPSLRSVPKDATDAGGL